MLFRSRRFSQLSNTIPSPFAHDLPSGYDPGCTSAKPRRPRSNPPARSAIIRSGKKKFSTPKENLPRDVRSPPADAMKSHGRSPCPERSSLYSSLAGAPLPACRPDKNVVGQPTTGREKSHRDRPARDGAHPAVMARRNTKRPSACDPGPSATRQRTASPHGKRCPRPVARQKKPDTPNEKGARSDSGHLRTGFHAAISAVFPYTCRSVS